MLGFLIRNNWMYTNLFRSHRFCVIHDCARPVRTPRSNDQQILRNFDVLRPPFTANVRKSLRWTSSDKCDRDFHSKLEKIYQKSIQFACKMTKKCKTTTNKTKLFMRLHGQWIESSLRDSMRLQNLLTYTYFSTILNFSSFIIRLLRFKDELILCLFDCLKALHLVFDSIYFSLKNIHFISCMYTK